MIKSIAAIIAVVAQLTQWLKSYLDKKNQQLREERNDEIRKDPAGEFADKFADPAKRVRDSATDASLSSDEAGAGADDNGQRDRTE